MDPDAAGQQTSATLSRRQHRVDRLRDKMLEQEAVVAAMRASKAHRDELATSLSKLKQLAALEHQRSESAQQQKKDAPRAVLADDKENTSTSAADVIEAKNVGENNNTVTEESVRREEEEASSLHRDVQELLATIETALAKQHQQTTNLDVVHQRRRTADPHSSPTRTSEALVEELLKEEQEERRKATKRKLDAKKRRQEDKDKKKKEVTRGNDKGTIKRGKAQGTKAKQSGEASCAQSEEEVAKQHHQSGSPGNQTGGNDVDAILAAVEIFAVNFCPASASIGSGVTSSPPEWLQDDVEQSIIRTPAKQQPGGGQCGDVLNVASGAAVEVSAGDASDHADYDRYSDDDFEDEQ